jgi:hypothetical protein
MPGPIRADIQALSELQEHNLPAETRLFQNIHGASTVSVIDGKKTSRLYVAKKT